MVLCLQEYYSLSGQLIIREDLGPPLEAAAALAWAGNRYSCLLDGATMWLTEAKAEAVVAILDKFRTLISVKVRVHATIHTPTTGCEYSYICI